ETYHAMGYDRLAASKTYEVNSRFDWKTMWSLMPMNALPGNKNNDIHFRFSTGTFDGQVTFLEGRKTGKTYGMQAWQGYQITKDGTLKTNDSKRYGWGLPTYHYVIEGPLRLLGADIVRYAGETTFEGQTYDLVYATWGEDAPHKEHDQWLVYINRETKMTDLTEVTINDFFIPTPEGMKAATIRFDRAVTSIGARLPSLVTIQLGKPKALKKHVYTFSLTDYRFDSFPLVELHPIEGLEGGTDRKPESK
ncbi:MAG: hypothetical protein AAF597_19155, partial [Bacteroidota bacterium]